MLLLVRRRIGMSGWCEQRQKSYTRPIKTSSVFSTWTPLEEIGEKPLWLSCCRPNSGWISSYCLAVLVRSSTSDVTGSPEDVTSYAHVCFDRALCDLEKPLIWAVYLQHGAHLRTHVDISSSSFMFWSAQVMNDDRLEAASHYNRTDCAEYCPRPPTPFCESISLPLKRL